MTLRITTADFDLLLEHVFRSAPEEGGAFLWCRSSGENLLVRGVRGFEEEELDRAVGGLQLTEEAKVALLRQAKLAGDAVVDVHNHPMATSKVGFSPLDQSELPDFARYVQLKLPDRAFGALVLGTHSVDGIIWKGRSKQRLDLEVVGEMSSLPKWMSSGPGDESIDLATFDRQLRALGRDAQTRLHSLKVAIVGLGGTGSVVVEQLAHLGVRRYVLVDDDRVEASNLPRLAGATRKDAARQTMKSKVAERLIRQIANRPEIVLESSLRSKRSLAAVQAVDLIVGCVDNDGARLILTELAAAYMVPYLDIGVSIEREVDGNLLSGGRVAFFIPGRPCLACADEIDFGEAAEDLESEALRSIRIARGYARDRRVEAALMPLNGTVAGMAMMELLAYVSGFRTVIPFFRYDASRQRTVIQHVTRQLDCPICGIAFAMGDSQVIGRYAID